MSKENSDSTSQDSHDLVPIIIDGFAYWVPFKKNKESDSIPIKRVVVDVLWVLLGGIGAGWFLYGLYLLAHMLLEWAGVIW